MSDINTYADETAIAGLSPINGDLVLNQADSSLYLCTNADTTGIARWKKFANDSAAIPFSNNYSLALDGSVDHATLDSTYPSITGSKSISGWFRFNNTSMNGFTTTTANQYGILFWTADTVFFRTGGGPRTFTLSSAITTNTWYHIAFTGDGTSLKCYVNGAQSGTTQTDGDWQIKEFFRGGTSFYFGGDVDEIALWENTALSGTDIATIANAGAPSGSKAIDLANYTGLTNWWRMGDSDGGQGTTITDVIGGNDLTTSHTNPFIEETP